MKSKTNVRAILIVLVIILALSSINYINLINQEDDSNNNKGTTLSTANFWNLTGSPILIDDTDPTKNWSYTVDTYDWCSGSGTIADPYRIENVTIDGQNSGTCVEIRNSDEHFIIKNCTIFNSDWGIFLDNVNYGTLFNNTIYDTQDGIKLEPFCINNSIIENTLYQNDYGIDAWRANYNNISKNVLYNHNYNGMEFNDANNNTILENKIINSIYNGLFFINCKNNTVAGNNVSYCGSIGIYLFMPCADFTISGNNASNCGIGIVITGSQRIIIGNYISNNDDSGISVSDDNNLIGNIIFNNTDEGIVLSTSNSDIIGNTITNNSEGIRLSSFGDNNEIKDNKILENDNHGILIEVGGDGNTIYKNEFIENGENANDAGANNQWDNGTIGNYWDDYGGLDADNDGIGDTPYDIPGTALTQDNFPIWRPQIILITPENKTYSYPMSGYYLGSYGFENDVNGPLDNPVSPIEDVLNVEVVSEFTGHKKVAKLEDLSGTESSHLSYRFASTDQNDGTIEFWWATNDTTKAGGDVFNLTRDATPWCIGYMRITSGSFGIRSGVSTIYHPIIPKNNTWYHIRVDWSRYGGYLGLGTREYKVTINGTEGAIADFNQNYDAGAMVLEINTELLPENVTWYIDAIGWGLDADYEIGANKKEGLLLSFVANKSLDRMWYSLDGQSYKAILGNTTIPMPYYGTHTIQLKVNDTKGNIYFSKVRHFSRYWIITGIFIDDTDPTKDWAYTESNYDWCSGSGTKNDPYTIEYAILDDTINIQNSIADFAIKNCIIKIVGIGHAIFMDEVSNGYLTDNYISCSFNGYAFSLRECNYTTIADNTIDNSYWCGIDLWKCYYNNISGNTVTSRIPDVGRGIRISGSHYNNISGNYIFEGEIGILISGSYNNFIGNEVSNCTTYGVVLYNSDHNNFTGNNIYNITDIGLAISGDETSSDNNLFYNNWFENNGINAADNGTNNHWNNSVIGNFWDDYTGVDKNDDGIGDTPYNITGTAKSQDNFPIWDDGPEPIPVPPPPSGGGGGGGGKDKKGEEAIHGYNLLILIGIAAIITVIITKKSREYSHKI